MPRVHISDVQVCNTTGTIYDKFTFKISYRIFAPLTDRIIWQLLFLQGKPLASQGVVLKTMEMELLFPGRYTFDLEASPPYVNDHPFLNTVGLYAVAISCSYRNQEFERFNYYVKIDYENPRSRKHRRFRPSYDKLQRSILVSHPVVEKNAINWDNIPKAQADKRAHLKLMDLKDEDPATNEDSMDSALGANMYLDLSAASIDQHFPPLNNYFSLMNIGD